MKKSLIFTILFTITVSTFSQVHFTSTLPDSLGLCPGSSIWAASTAFADINNDCYIDIFVAGDVWLNNGTGHFTKQNNPWISGGITCFGDYNNDGYPDALIPSGTHVHLLKNIGPPTYNLVNVDSIAGVDSIYADGYFNDVAWIDFNNDGWIDFYVTNYESPVGVGHPDHFFINNGDGTFTDISSAAGVNGPSLCSRGITVFDYNNDGFQDIFISVYRLQRNLLWRNNGNGTFTDVAASTGVQGLYLQNYYGHNIGTTAGDYNNDGYMDLFSPITHHATYPGDYTNHLWRNSGPFTNYNFIDHSNAGTYNAEIGSAPYWIDYDNDGDLDLYYVNLYGAPLGRCWMYRNNGNNSFTDVTNSLGFPTNLTSDFGIFADLNNDGFPDGFCPFTTGIKFYMSNANNLNHWLTVKLIGSATPTNTSPTTSNAMGIGAKVIAYTHSRNVMRENNHNSGNGYGSMYVPFLHFGLGSDTLIDTLQIRWPSGHVENFYNVAVDTNLCITEYTGITTSISKVSYVNEGIKVYPNPSNGVYQIYNVKSQFLKAEVYNILGKKVYQSLNFNANKSNIDISTKPTGIYYLRLTDVNNEVNTVSLIKD